MSAGSLYFVEISIEVAFFSLSYEIENGSTKWKDDLRFCSGLCVFNKTFSTAALVVFLLALVERGGW